MVVVVDQTENCLSTVNVSCRKIVSPLILMLMTSPATGLSERSTRRALGVDDDGVAGSGSGGGLIRNHLRPKIL